MKRYFISYAEYSGDGVTWKSEIIDEYPLNWAMDEENKQRCLQFFHLIDEDQFNHKLEDNDYER